mgnify:CR=1 FL=1
MRSELVTSGDVYNVIRRALGFMDNTVLQHGEITAYIFYNMLKIIRNILQQFIDNIDAGNTNLTCEQQCDIIRVLIDIRPLHTMM